MGKRTNRQAGGSRGEWLERLKLDKTPLMSEKLNQESFHEFVSLVADDAIDMLTEDGSFPACILAVDSSWRSVHIFDGAKGPGPARVERGSRGKVRVTGALLDNIPVVRRIFTHLGIKAAIFRAEAWKGTPESWPMGLSRDVTRSTALGRSETLVVEALCPQIGYYRFLDCPIIRLDGRVTAGVLHDTAKHGSVEAVDSPLMKCFPFRARAFGEVG